MIAIILAAGLGTRLYPLTKDIPKCLVKIGGESILEKQTKMLRDAGISEIRLVIGEKGDSWTEENRQKIREIEKKVIINERNLDTSNSYSLRLALNNIENEDALILDGDDAFSENLLKKLIDARDNCIVSKKQKENPGNRIVQDEIGRVKKISRQEASDYVYGGIMKIKKESVGYLKNILSKEEYVKKDTGFVLDELCKKEDIYNIVSDEWININSFEDLKEAEVRFARKFVAIMFGYTATGKSTLANLISQKLGTEIFHSAVVRKELNLAPKTLEEADKFFDFRNNLREEVDRKVYAKLAEKAGNAMKNGKNVIADAGYFFKWQRELIYEKAKENGAEIFVIKVRCDDENEIKRRIEERARQFGSNPLHETPSWNTYLATKQITEPITEEEIKKSGLGIIDYEGMKNELDFRGKESENSKRILKAIETKNFVIALDFDGLITHPYGLRVELLNKMGYNFNEGNCTREDCLKAGVPLEEYEKASIGANITSPEKLPLVEGFLENYEKIRGLKDVQVYVVTRRYNSMMPHLEEYLKHYKIAVDGILNTEIKSKTAGILRIKPQIFVEDSLKEIERVAAEMPEVLQDTVCVLYRNSSNLSSVIKDARIKEARSWREIWEIVKQKYENFTTEN